MAALRASIAWACLAGFSVLLVAQEPVKTDAEVADESTRADALIQKQDFVDALPLYEDLHRLRPNNNFYRERLSMSLFGVAGAQLKSPEESRQMRLRARQLLLDAQKSGDNSSYVQVMLEKTQNIEKEPVASTPQSPAAQALSQGEKAFASGDLENALKLYEAAYRLDPTLYAAPLFAGDSAYKLNQYDQAGRWYEKAIAIDANRETAYRYWGDVLYHAGKAKEAKSKFIDAIVAEPYTRTPWVGLKQWADAEHYTMSSPSIRRPQAPTSDPKKPGQTNIVIDPSILGKGDSGGAAWLAYSLQRALWQGDLFKKSFPKETKYRHTLTEETESLRAVLSVAKESKSSEKNWDESLRSLAALEKDGMLEAWILINGADQDIIQDYPSYRENHRDLLHAYIEKHVLHPPVK